MITLDEIETRIIALKQALLNIQTDQKLFWDIRKEMEEYVNLRRHAIELKLSEINNQVATNYYSKIKCS